MNDKEAVIAGLRNMARDRQYKNHRQGRTGGFFGGVLNPDPTVNLRPGRIWVREGADGMRAQSEALIVGIVDAIADIPVWLAETVEGGELCVLGPVVTTRNLEAWGGGLPSTGVPRQPSVLTSQLTKSDNILTGRIGPSTAFPSTLYVYIQPFWIAGKQYGGIDHDVGSANVPGSANEHRWCMICVDKDNATYTLTGTTVSRAGVNQLLLDTSDVDMSIPAGYIPVGMVSLSYSQTDISSSRFEDVREWIAARGTLLSEDAETLTIATGAVTAGGGSHFIMAAESGTADDLATITTTGVSRMIIVRADSGDTITVKHGTGNISLNSGADYALSGDKTLALFWNGAELTDLSAISASSSGGSTQAAVYASLTTGSDGDLRFPTDGFHVFRSNGSALVPWGPLFPLTLPSFSGAWTNQGSATITTEKGSIVLTTPGNASGAALRVYTKAAPSTPYTITVAFIPFFLTVAAATGSIGCGILFRQSSDGKLATLELEAVNSATEASIYNFLASRKWTDATTFSATYVNSVVASLFLGGVVWMRIADNGTNRICSVSNDGQTWKVLHSVGRTDFLTADEIGFFLRADGATANDSTMRIISYAEA